MRGADVGPPARIVALSALMIGLYYDRAALSAALALVKPWTAEDRQRLRDDAPRLALDAVVAGRRVLDVARDTLAIAEGGLKRRARKNAKGEDETIWLAPLKGIVESGRAPAQGWLDLYDGPWRHSVEPAFQEAVF